jgi:hypothetical protein
VTSTLNAEDVYFYPDDVITEVRAEIRVRGRAYRAYSSGGGNNADPQNIGEAKFGPATETINTSSFTEVARSSPDVNNGEMAGIHCGLILSNPSGGVGRVKVKLYDDTRGEYVTFFDYTLDVSGESSATFFTTINYDADGNTILWEAKGVDSGGDVTVEAYYLPFGKHTHPPEPGLTEFGLYPSNCDVLVNGTSAGVSLGDGTAEFAETVDISGLLTPGDNEIEITSDTTGRVPGAVRTELFRQGPEDTI